MNEIEQFDERILEILRHNNRVSSETIARQIGLSTSAVVRRTQRMRKSGITQADVSIVSPAVFGRTLSAVIGVTLENENAFVLNEFKREIISAEEATQCLFVTGEVNFILIVSVKDMADFERFASRFLTDNPHVKRYVINIVISEVKSVFGGV